jgi:hypothetical protein
LVPSLVVDGNVPRQHGFDFGLWTRSIVAIRARARRRGAAIFFFDEAGGRSDAPPGHTRASRGQTPVVPTNGQRQSVNAIPAVTPRGEFRWRTFGGRINASRFLEFLRAFMHRRHNPVVLIADRLPAHIATIVAACVQQSRGRNESLRARRAMPQCVSALEAVLGGKAVDTEAEQFEAAHRLRR